jgi:hypothetical protein
MQLVVKAVISSLEVLSLVTSLLTLPDSLKDPSEEEGFLCSWTLAFLPHEFRSRGHTLTVGI